MRGHIHSRDAAGERVALSIASVRGMPDDESLDLPPVRAQSLLSDDEQDLLTALAGEYDLTFLELNELIERERSMQGLGRRPRIHIWIQSHIAKIAERRLEDR
jgi:hypothetical protein